jgi:hypothetical protein
MGHLLTPALKENRRTRTERHLQWHAENGHENILFMDEKILTMEEQYNRQNDKNWGQTSRESKEKFPMVQRGHHPSYFMVWWGLSHQGVTPLHFCEKGMKTGARVYQEDMLQGVVKPLNTTLFSSQIWVFSRTQLLPTRRLRSGCGSTFRHLSAPRIGPRGIQTSTPWTINCGLFWRTWLAESVTTT